MCHVLIIEDDALVALDIQGLLADQGATSFDVAETQSDAVACALARRPDVITSDVNLREGTGPFAVEEIVAQVGLMPIIFITGSPEACVPCAVGSAILTKPLREAELLPLFRNVAPV